MSNKKGRKQDDHSTKVLILLTATIQLINAIITLIEKLIE